MLHQPTSRAAGYRPKSSSDKQAEREPGLLDVRLFSKPFQLTQSSGRGSKVCRDRWPRLAGRNGRRGTRRTKIACSMQDSMLLVWPELLTL